ncbi:ThuA domain-containing protein [Lacunisphaera limnophila]|nr:ThuA domain-containing protein [Lacunisphaera limnophila]
MYPSRVLVFCDDRYHPASLVRAGLAFLNDIYRFDWVEDPRNRDPASLANYGVVVLAKSNHCTSADHAPWTGRGIEEQLDRYIQAGGGLVALHSGTAGYQGVSSIRSFLGGVFTGHPPPCEVQFQPEGSHEILNGIHEDFSIDDEHYQMEMDDPDVSVFLRSKSACGTQPAGWTRSHGQGRVCVLTPGHTAAVWHHHAYRQLLHNSIRWAANDAHD